MRKRAVTLALLTMNLVTMGCSPSCSPEIAEANPETISCPALHHRLEACDFNPFTVSTVLGYSVNLSRSTSVSSMGAGGMGATVCEAERDAYRRAMAILVGR